PRTEAPTSPWRGEVGDRRRREPGGGEAESPHPGSSRSLAADPPPPGEGKDRAQRGSGKARKPNLDEMGPGAHKESLPYRPAGGARPRSTAGKGGTRAWPGRRR